MSATTEPITTLGNIMDELDAIIDHSNRAFDVAHQNNLPAEADRLMSIKSEVWSFRKKLVRQVDAIRQTELDTIIGKGHHPC